MKRRIVPERGDVVVESAIDYVFMCRVMDIHGSGTEFTVFPGVRRHSAWYDAEGHGEVPGLAQCSNIFQGNDKVARATQVFCALQSGGPKDPELEKYYALAAEGGRLRFTLPVPGETSIEARVCGVAVSDTRHLGEVTLMLECSTPQFVSPVLTWGGGDRWLVSDRGGRYFGDCTDLTIVALG